MENYQQRLIDIWGSNVNDAGQALAWIEAAIERQAPESLYLDFKQKSDPREPTPNDEDKAHLARAISGFANTDGGLIVWGVKCKVENKGDPDVATALVPIAPLITFHSRLESLSGELTDPFVTGVNNRMVPTAPGSNKGYVITIIPKRGDTLINANAKTCKGFYVRSGSGFYQLPEPLIAEFYRRKSSPLLRLFLDLAHAKDVTFDEQVSDAENWKTIQDRKHPWGRCSFRQHLFVDWSASLRNEGRASASQVVVELSVSSSAEWSIINFGANDRGYHDRSRTWIPVYSPPQTFFAKASSSVALGKVLDPIHPGQDVKLAAGVLHIPFEAFDGTVDDFTISGFAYATDTPSFSIAAQVAGPEFRSRYSARLSELREAAPATRLIPEPFDPRFQIDMP